MEYTCTRTHQVHCRAPFPTLQTQYPVLYRVNTHTEGRRSVIRHSLKKYLCTHITLSSVYIHRNTLHLLLLLLVAFMNTTLTDHPELYTNTCVPRVLPRPSPFVYISLSPAVTCLSNQFFVDLSREFHSLLEK